MKGKCTNDRERMIVPKFGAAFVAMLPMIPGCGSQQRERHVYEDRGSTPEVETGTLSKSEYDRWMNEGRMTVPEVVEALNHGEIRQGATPLWNKLPRPFVVMAYHDSKSRQVLTSVYVMRDETRVVTLYMETNDRNEVSIFGASTVDFADEMNETWHFCDMDRLAEHVARSIERATLDPWDK